MTRHLFSKFKGMLMVFLFLAGAALAQTPKEQAWQILNSAASSSKAETRANNARALGLITNNSTAVDLLQKALDDKEATVRAAAATSLGLIKAKSTIPKLIETAQQDADGQVVMAIAKALVDMGEEKGYAVFYAIVTAEKKSGEGLVASQEKMMTDMMKNPKALENEAFQQGIGFVPYGGVAMGAYQAVHKSGKSQALVKATALKVLAKDPDPKSGKALVTATNDKEWIVRAAAYDALARRGDSSVLPDIANGLTDKEEVVKLTAAATIVHLAEVKSTGGE